jgi:hypothetical protein
LFERLHLDKCDRDKAAKRELHYDKLCMLVLLDMFNSTVILLRSITQATELTKVKKRLGCGRTSLGSLSEASRVIDSHRLKKSLPNCASKPSRFTEIKTFSESIKPSLWPTDHWSLVCLSVSGRFANRRSEPLK